jgi:hypothetical protein
MIKPSLLILARSPKKNFNNSIGAIVAPFNQGGNMDRTLKRMRARPRKWPLLFALLLALGVGCKKDEVCNDGKDNNKDGKTDCADAACSADPACAVTEDCDNNTDDDGDGLVDCADATNCCADAACAQDPVCSPTEDCDNGVDDDGDNQIDCADNDCNADAACQEDCNNGVDDDNNNQIDCTDSDCAQSADCAAPSAANNVVQAGFSGTLATAVSNDAQTAFLTAYNANDEAAVFSVPAAGGSAAQLFGGSPLNKPTGLALSPDGLTLFIADVAAGANETGALFTMPVGGATPTEINIAPLILPSVIAISDNGTTLFIGATNANTSVTGVFSLPITGGANNTLLATVKDPAAVNIVGNNLLIADAEGADGLGVVITVPIAGGQPTIVASGQRIEYPAGVSSTPDNQTLLFTAVDPSIENNGSAVFSVPIGGGNPSPVNFGVTFTSAGSLARARFTGVWTVLDTEGNATGTMFRLE